MPLKCYRCEPPGGLRFPAPNLTSGTGIKGGQTKSLAEEIEEWAATDPECLRSSRPKENETSTTPADDAASTTESWFNAVTEWFNGTDNATMDESRKERFLPYYGNLSVCEDARGCAKFTCDNNYHSFLIGIIE